MLCYRRDRSRTAKPAWFMRSATPGRQVTTGAPAVFAHVTTRTGLTLTTSTLRPLPSANSSVSGGLVPELADALRAAASNYFAEQPRRVLQQGRSKYLRYKDAHPMDIDMNALERHRRGQAAFLS